MEGDLVWLGLIVGAVVALAVWHGKHRNRPGQRRSGSSSWAGDWDHSDRGGGDSGG